MKLQEIIEFNAVKHRQDGFKGKSIRMPSGMMEYLKMVMKDDIKLEVNNSDGSYPRIFGMEITIDDTLAPHEFRIIAAR